MCAQTAGELDLDDDVATATALFECMNTIVEDRVARPKQMKALYSKLPRGRAEGDRQAGRRADDVAESSRWHRG